MDHSYFKDRVSAYYDQDLPLQELELMRRHVADCEECQAMLAELGRLDQLVDQKSTLSESVDYWEESARKIESALSSKAQPAAVTDIKRSSWSGLWWKASSVAAAVLVVGFVALHRFEILEPDTDKVEPSMSTAPALRQERTDSLLHKTDESDQAPETNGTEPDRRLQLPESKPSAASEETPIVQKAKRRQVQSLGAQEPTAQPSPPKPSTTDMSKYPIEDEIQLAEDIAEPEKDKSKLALKKSAESKVAVRGGRAGEVEYLVDGDKDEELAEKVDTDKTKKKGLKELAAEAIEPRGDIHLNSMSNNLASRQKDSTDSKGIGEKGRAARIDPPGDLSVPPFEDWDVWNSSSSFNEPIRIWRSRIYQITEVLAPSSKRAPANTNALNNLDDKAVDSLRQMNEKWMLLLLEAHYGVCMLTPDKSEYYSSYASLKQSSLASDSSIVATSLKYLQTLDSLNRFSD